MELSELNNYKKLLSRQECKDEYCDGCFQYNTARLYVIETDNFPDSNMRNVFLCDGCYVREETFCHFRDSTS